MSANINYLKVDLIRIDGGTQSRAHLNQNVINEYANLFNHSNDILPPIKVFFDGQDYWNADGFHRLEAAKQANLEVISAIIEQGTRRDAILFSVGANAEHGLRRNDDDKHRAVNTLLTDDEWSHWSDNQIAKKCKVSQPFVSKLRKELNVSTVNVDSKEQRTYERNGKNFTMKTNNIGKKLQEEIKKAIKPYISDMEKDPNTKDIFESNQFKEAVKQELENSHPELVERFDQDVELPSYNVISEELFLKKEFIKGQAEKIAELEKLLDLSDKFYKQAEYSESKTKEKLAQLEKEIGELKSENGLLKEEARLSFKEQVEFEEKMQQYYATNSEIQLIKFTNQVAELIGFNQEILIRENVLDKLKEIMKLTNKVSEITEANNQLFLANENLTKELNEIKQNNVGLNKWMTEQFNEKNQKISSLAETNNQLFLANENLNKELNEIKQNNIDLENKLDEVRLINSNIIELEKNNKNLEDQIDTLTRENKTLKEANGKLKLVVKPSNSNQSDEMLASIQRTFEISLEKGVKKGEGIRIGRKDSTELLNSIKQALGVE